MTTKEPLRIKDAKNSIILRYTSGCILASTGLALGLHSAWHAFSPEMLLIGLLFVIFGGYLTYRASEEAKEKYHEMTRAFFKEV
jgi:hypothetical protein